MIQRLKASEVRSLEGCSSMPGRFLALYAISLLWLAGCGGSSQNGMQPPPQTPQFGIVSGNWDLDMLSLSPALGMRAGGSLVQNGTAISGLLHISGSPCFDPLADDLVVSGTATGGAGPFGGTITFSTAPVRGQTITFTSGSQLPTLPGLNNLLNGSFTLSGGTCSPEVRGVLAGGVVTPATGTWKGAFTPSLVGAVPLGVTANLMQSGPDAHGFFQISGTFAFTGSKCFTSGTITSSNVVGASATFTIVTNDSSQLFFSAMLPDAANGASLQGPYQIQTGACSFDSGDGLLNKQP